MMTGTPAAESDVVPASILDSFCKLHLLDCAQSRQSVGWCVDVRTFLRDRINFSL